MGWRQWKETIRRRYHSQKCAILLEVEGAQSLNGVGWVVREPVSTAAEVAKTPLSLSIAFLMIYLERSELLFRFAGNRQNPNDLDKRGN